MVRKYVDPFMERYFKCDICLMGFKLEHFSRHYNLIHNHCENKHLNCEHSTCNKKFKLQPDKLAHFRLKHITYVFWCTRCERMYSSINDFQLHKSEELHLNPYLPINHSKKDQQRMITRIINLANFHWSDKTE